MGVVAGLIGNQSRSLNAGSGIWLTVGRTIPLPMASMARAASMGREAPQAVADLDLFAETGMPDRSRPKTALRHSTSVLSPVGVEVPWALIAPISEG